MIVVGVLAEPRGQPRHSEIIGIMRSYCVDKDDEQKMVKVKVLFVNTYSYY